MKKKQKAKGSFYENLKLRQKMSLILGTLTFFVLLGLLYFLIHSFEITMDKKIDANMADKSAQASNDLEDLMTKLDAITDNIEQSISFVFAQNDEVGGVPGNPWKIRDIKGNEQTPRLSEREIEERYPNLTLLDRNNIIEFIEKIQNDKFSANDLREMQETYAKIEWKNDKNIIHKLFRKY